MRARIEGWFRGKSAGEGEEKAGGLSPSNLSNPLSLSSGTPFKELNK